MNKILFFLLVILSCLGHIGYTQSPCASVSVEAFPMNPQTGEHNYFGVRVTLAQSFSEDITVHGDIMSDGYPSQSFSFTVISGILTTETDASFYQTGPASEANVNVTFVSPCPDDEVEINPFNSSNQYDSAGVLHNIGLENLINNGLTKNNFSSIWIPYTSNMLTNNGYNGSQFANYVSTDTSSSHFGKIGSNTFVSPEVLLTRLRDSNEITQQQYSYISQIYQALDQLDESSNETIQQTIDLIKTYEQTAITNMNSEDVVLVLMAASIARHSTYYWATASQTPTGWNIHGTTFINQIDNQPLFAYSSRNSGPNNNYYQPTFRIDWGHIGKSDVAGGVAGAAATGVARFFGPIGWKIWAGATIGGAVGASVYETIMSFW